MTNGNMGNYVITFWNNYEILTPSITEITISNLKIGGMGIMDVIDIERLYNKNKVKIAITAEIPIEVYNLMLALFDDAYYYGLHGLSLEEYVGALTIAGICMSTQKKRWEKIIPVYEEGLYDYL
jgi:hypothetical protein